jgi:hypothetical protein
MFIELKTDTYMNIYVFIVFKKKNASRGQTSKSPAIRRDGVRSGGLVTPAASRGGNVTPTRESPTASSVRSSKRGGEGRLRQNHRPRRALSSCEPHYQHDDKASGARAPGPAPPGHATLRRRFAQLACSVRAHHTTWSVVLLHDLLADQRFWTSAQLDTD